MFRDVRFAIRSFVSNPGFTAAAILSLAIGIGANTSIFSVTNALFLRPFPYKDADSLAILWNRSPGLGIAEDWFSTAQYFDIKAAGGDFDAVGIAIGGNYNLTGDGAPERIGVVRVSSNFLPLIGAQPLLGRSFEAAEDRAGSAGTAILNHGFWMRRFGGAQVIGKPIVLNGQLFQVVGIMPPSFTLPREVLPTLGGAEDADILLSLPLAANAAEVRNREDYNIVAKLKPGVAPAAAQTRMDALTARLRQDHPEFYPPNGGLTFSVVPLRDQVVGDARRPVLILLAAGAFVLLVACANVANLLLSRIIVRRKEMAVRAALGASRTRLMQQLLTETITLAIVGGAIGGVLASWSIRGIQQLGARSVPRLSEISMDTSVFAFTLVLSLAAGTLFGVVPALRFSRSSLQTRGGSERGHGLRRLLVVTELALSVVLLIGSGLLVRSFNRLQQVEMGFRPNSVLTFELTMTGRKYNDADATLETYRQLWERLDRLPGVQASGGISALPLSRMMAWGPITVEGRTAPAGERFINADQRTAAGRYFEAMGIPLIAGRLFNTTDTRTSPRVIIVDEFMARSLWPGQDAVGKRIRSGGIDASESAPWLTVVGVVGSVKQDGLDAESRIAFYYPHAQVPARALTVVVHGANDLPAVRAQLRELDPELPLYRVSAMTSRVSGSLARQRFAMSVLAGFAALALALAVMGVYGVMSYLVSQTTREFGIRMALGASPQGVLQLVLRRTTVVAVAGITAGVLGALALTRFMRSLLFGIAATDGPTFAAVTVTLTVVFLAAGYLPARRAARIDPVVSLRSE
jgi:predicted permease